MPDTGAQPEAQPATAIPIFTPDWSFTSAMPRQSIDSKLDPENLFSITLDLCQSHLKDEPTSPRSRSLLEELSTTCVEVLDGNGWCPRDRTYEDVVQRALHSIRILNEAIDMDQNHLDSMHELQQLFFERYCATYKFLDHTITEAYWDAMARSQSRRHWHRGTLERLERENAMLTAWMRSGAPELQRPDTPVRRHLAEVGAMLREYDMAVLEECVANSYEGSLAFDGGLIQQVIRGHHEEVAWRLRDDMGKADDRIPANWQHMTPAIKSAIRRVEDLCFGEPGMI